MHRNVYLIAALIAIGAHAGTTYAIVVSSNENQPVTPGKPRYGIDLDGVAFLGNPSSEATSVADMSSPRCSGALITNRHVLSAAHCFDEDSDGIIDGPVRELPFVAAFDLAEGDLLLEIDPAAIHLPPDWPVSEEDIAVVELKQAVPAEVAHYQLYGRPDEIGRQVVIAGYGTTGLGVTGADESMGVGEKRVGLNRLEWIEKEFAVGYDFDSGNDANNTLSLFSISSDLGFGVDEVQTSTGDSGGPLFIDGSIAAVSAYGVRPTKGDINDEHDESWGELAFATRVSSFKEFISTATNGQAVFTVPEPKLCPAWLVCAVGALVRRCRQRQVLRRRQGPGHGEAHRKHKSPAAAHSFTDDLGDRSMRYAIWVLVLTPFSTWGAELVRFEEVKNAPRTGDILARSVSADGSVVLLDKNSGGPAWVWTQSGGIQELEAVEAAFPGQEESIRVLAISGDGTYISGGVRSNGFVWNRDLDAMEQLEAFGTVRPFDFSFDGEVVVGWHNTDEAFDFQQAFRWTRESGVVDLGVPTGWVSSLAGGVTSDGSTIVGQLLGNEIKNEIGRGIGHDNYDGFIWKDGEFFELGLPGEPTTHKSAVDVSDDGSAVAAVAGGELYLWESAGPTLTPLGRPEGYNSIQGWWNEVNMSADGKVIIGQGINRVPGTTNQVEPGRAGFIWDAAHGIRHLTDVLRDEHGVTYPEERGFEYPRGISDDKKVVVGWTQGPRGHRAWAVYLDRPLDWVVGDANHDLHVDFADFLALSSNFGLAGNWGQGDFDSDGQVEFDDFLMLADKFGFQPKFSFATAASVPEPSSSVLLIMGIATLLRRSRRVFKRSGKQDG